jgi:hypothetical protein
MKQAILIIAIVGVIPVSSLTCTHNSRARDEAVPAWLTTLIHSLEADPVAVPPAKLTRYTYRGQTVFYLPPRCCDVLSTLYDAEGRKMCSPDGGLTGKGDGRCADFFTERTDERPIWEDTRRQGR